MSGQVRYAVYFVPSVESPVTGLANSLMGRDMENALSLAQPKLEGCAPKRLKELTAEPRRYGFHATLKAPFYLAPGFSENDVLAAAESFSSLHETFTVNALHIKRISSFLALVPKVTAEDDGSIPKLKQLAGSALEFFDALRKKPTREEIAKRKSASLSAKQTEYLMTWGYPYVLEEYKFHLTLTGRMRARNEAAKIKADLNEYFGASLQVPLKIDSICICKQTRSEVNPADFSLLQRFLLNMKTDR